LNFTKDWPNATLVKLEQNYRSTGNIIAGANAVIKNNTVQTPKNLWTENPDGEPIVIVSAEDSETEASWVAGEIRRLRNKNPETEVGILYRTNAQSRAIEQALIANNLPYKIFGGLTFYQRKEVKDVLAGLRLAHNPLETASAERIQASLGKRAGTPVISAMRESMQGENGARTAPELIEIFLKASNYKDFLDEKFTNGDERMDNIAELINFSGSFATLGEFLERAALLQSSDRPSTQQGRSGQPVNLMTIHIAKGLG
jgi:superfamily I DNA/RNA helicase